MAKVMAGLKLRCSSILGWMKRRISLTLSMGEEEEEEKKKKKKGPLVPGDVKEGQFAVYAGGGGELRRFIVDLECLAQPEFLGLLRQAEEEFGFAREGPLLVPCRPGDFVRILRGRTSCVRRT